MTKNKKVFIFLVSLLITLFISVSTYSASNELTDIYMENRHENNVFVNESELASYYATYMTGNSIIGRNNHDLVTNDSEDYKDVPGISTGIIETQLIAPGGEPPKIKSDNELGYQYVEEMTGYLYPTDWPKTREEWEAAYIEVLGGDPSIYGENFGEVISDIAQNNDNIYVAAFAEKLGSPVEIKIGFDKDTGRHYWEVPEGIDFGQYFLGKITINGIDFTYDANGRIFIELGDGENDDPDDDNPPTDEPEPESEDDGNRYYSIDITTTPYALLTPSPTGSISNGNYNVEKAIPTSENLNFFAKTEKALYNILQRNYKTVAGVRNITIKVTTKYNTTETKKKTKTVWTACTHMTSSNRNPKPLHPDGHETKETYYVTETVTKNYSYTFSQKYTSDDSKFTKYYYDVPISEIFPVYNATISGVPVDGNKVSLALAGSGGPSSKRVKVTGELPDVSNTFSISYGEIYSNKNEAMTAAQSSTAYDAAVNEIEKRIASAIHCDGNFNYTYTQSNTLHITPESSNSTNPGKAYVESSTTRMIPSTKTNGNYGSTASVSYGNGTFSFGINDVFVHTPVVNNAGVINQSKFINQKINKLVGAEYTLMLDEQFTVTIPNNGTHINEKGYGNRNYNSNQAVPKQAINWGKIKDMKFSFDVYLHDGNTRTLIKAGSWLSYYGKATSNNTYTFTIPVWAEEGEGIITTRVIAENAPSNDSPSQIGANLDSTNYIATKEIKVDVIGKIYDLRISSTNDPGWLDKIVSKNKNNYIPAEEFPFGRASQNKISGYEYAPKLGYYITFDFKTKGIKSNNVDVSIQPEGFYFVSKTGSTATAEKVDLYYSTTAQKYVKIEPADSKVPVITNLTYPYMKVSKTELNDSVNIMNKILGRNYIYSENVYLGYFAKLSMAEKLRLCYNNFAEYIGSNGMYKKDKYSIAADAVNGHSYTNDWAPGTSWVRLNNNGEQTVIGSVGHWYAGYRLPSSTVAVASGIKPDAILKDSSLIKENGYILVKFKIKTKYNTYDYLEYLGPESLNEAGDNTGNFVKDENGTTLNWNDTSKTQKVKLPDGTVADVPIGTVAVFETNYRASDDVESVGTH